MRLYLLLALVITVAANAALAQRVDIIGGPYINTQTIHHCGYLPTTGGRYTDSDATTRLLQQKLRSLGYYYGPIDGIAGPKTTLGIRNFQSNYGLSVDGVAGPQTAQRLAYFTHKASNVRRCWRQADPRALSY